MSQTENERIIRANLHAYKEGFKDWFTIKPFDNYCVIWVGETWYSWHYSPIMIPCLALYEDCVIRRAGRLGGMGINEVPPHVPISRAFKSNNFSRPKLLRAAKALASRKDIENYFLAQKMK